MMNMLVHDSGIVLTLKFRIALFHEQAQVQKDALRVSCCDTVTWLYKVV